MFGPANVFALGANARALLPRLMQQLPHNFADEAHFRQAFHSCVRRANEAEVLLVEDEEARQNAWHRVHAARHELAHMALHQTPVNMQAWFEEHDALMGQRWRLIVELAEAKLTALTFALP